MTNKSLKKKMPKIVDKEKMKQGIMEAALSAFLKHGFHNTTMIKIAKEAGIAKGTLYLYFDSKEKLIQKIADKHFEKIKEQLIPKEPFETIQALLAHIKTALLVSDKESQFIPIFFEVFGPSFSSNDFIKKYQDFFDEIGFFYEDNFSLLIEKHEINKTIEPAALGRAFVSMLDGLVLHKGLFSIDNKAYKRMVEETLGLFERGLQI